MDKISSIIPSNNRISSVDLQEARPLRPGVPTHGQPVGRSEIVRFSKSALETVKDGQRTRSVTEERNVKIADTLAKKFFREKSKDVEGQQPIATPTTEVAPQEIEVVSEQTQSSEPTEISTPYLGDDLFDSEADKLERVTTTSQTQPKISDSQDEDQEVAPYSANKKEIRPGILLDKKA